MTKRALRNTIALVGGAAGSILIALLFAANVKAAPAAVDTTILAPTPPCPYASLFGCFKPHWDSETLGGDAGNSGGAAGNSGGDGGGDNGGEGPGCAY